MSVQFANAIEINRPIEEVFAYLADFENIPAWNYAIVETEKTSEGPVGIGATFRQVRSVPSHGEETFEVTDYRPHQSVTISGTLGPFTGDLRYQLDPIESGTRLTNEVDLQPRGIAGLVGQLAGSRVKDAVAANLNELKRILESS